MKVVVPLAGPDFVVGNSVKACFQYNNKPLLRHVLENRLWWLNGTCTDEDFVFILQSDAISKKFVDVHLLSWYPKAKIVYLANYTQGAALSALAGISLLSDLSNEIICIDLADIYFDLNICPSNHMIENKLNGLALTFESNSDIYSYLRIDSDGNVIEAAEKKVISNRASSGTYFFASAQTYINSLAYVIRQKNLYLHNGLFYVCPVFNGVINSGGKVGQLQSINVVDVKVDGF
jgi:hypothetical protein